MYCYLLINFPISYDECLLFGTYETNIKEINFDVLLEGIRNELIHEQQNLLNLKTIYITSGVTKNLTLQQWKKLLEMIQPFTSNIVEYNIEIHGDFNAELFFLWKEYKVNRLVWKVGTFDTKLLLANNCSHTTDQSLIKQVAQKNFAKLAVDLNYKLKGQTRAMFEKDLRLIDNLEISHLSCYESDFEASNFSYQIVKEKLKKFNYICYEKNNFVKNVNDVAAHQESYWKLHNYLGVGLGATSFTFNKLPIVKQNTYDYPEWKQETMQLTMRDYYYGLLMVGLGVVSGMDLNFTENRQAYEYYKKEVDTLLTKNLLSLKHNILVCPEENFHLLDTMLLEIMEF